MHFNFEWNNGLILGIAQDNIYCVDTEEESPKLDDEPDNMIIVYLGLFNLTFIFERDKPA